MFFLSPFSSLFPFLLFSFPFLSFFFPFSFSLSFSLSLSSSFPFLFSLPFPFSFLSPFPIFALLPDFWCPGGQSAPPAPPLATPLAGNPSFYKKFLSLLVFHQQTNIEKKLIVGKYGRDSHIVYRRTLIIKKKPTTKTSVMKVLPVDKKSE